MNKGPLIAIGIAVLIGIAIYQLPRSKQENKEPAIAAENHMHSFDFPAYVKDLIDRNFADAEQQNIAEWSGQIKRKAANQKLALDSLTSLLDSKKLLAASAYFAENFAENNNEEKAWLSAGFHYFDAYKTAIDSALRNATFEKAIYSYNKVLELNAENLDAKTDLGVLYTETANPMKGITLLREVVSKDPKHENAQFNLGVLSLKSGQVDKAIERFEIVRQLNPNRLEVLPTLAALYAKSGNKEKSEFILKEIIRSSKDKELVAQAKAMLQEQN